MKGIAFSALVLAGVSIGIAGFTAYKTDVFDSQGNEDSTHLVEIDGTPFGAVRAWFENYPYWERGQEKSVLAESVYYGKIKEELTATLEVVDFLQADEIGVALVRYSIGRNVYRNSLWLREVDSKWFPSALQYYSPYGDDPFKDGNGERAKDIIEAAEEWEEESTEQWWLWY